MYYTWYDNFIQLHFTRTSCTQISINQPLPRNSSRSIPYCYIPKYRRMAVRRILVSAIAAAVEIPQALEYSVIPPKHSSKYKVPFCLFSKPAQESRAIDFTAIYLSSYFVRVLGTAVNFLELYSLAVCVGPEIPSGHPWPPIFFSLDQGSRRNVPATRFCLKREFYSRIHLMQDVQFYVRLSSATGRRLPFRCWLPWMDEFLDVDGSLVEELVFVILRIWRLILNWCYQGNLK